MSRHVKCLIRSYKECRSRLWSGEKSVGKRMNVPLNKNLFHRFGYHWAERTFVLLCISIGLTSNFFVFGPFAIYQGNLDEFALPLPSIFTFFLLPASILIFILFSIGLTLPKELYTRYVSIIFVLSLLSWLQGNIIVWKYGVLDGTAVDWSTGVWRGWVDALLWVLGLIIAFVFYRRIYQSAAYVSIILFSLQLVLLVFTSLQKPEIWEKKKLPLNSEPEGISQFSSTQNIIHILFDAFQSDVFHEIVDKDPHYYTDMKGFVFFEEATTAHNCTTLSVPAFLSGYRFENDRPISEFARMAVGRGNNIPYVMHNNGYEIDMINSPIPQRYYDFQCDNMWYSGVPYRKEEEKTINRTASIYLLDLTLFRYVPHFLKKEVYHDQTWLLSSLLGKYDYARHPYFAYTSSFQDFIDDMSVKRKRPVYKFINLVIPHIPLVVNSDCEYAGKVLPLTREHVLNQSKCALDFFVEFIEKLKILGIYESSLIIINADHGFYMPFQFRDKEEQSLIRSSVEQEFGEYGHYLGRLLPLLAIKAPYGKGPLSISDNQVELTDIPATINAVLGLNETFRGRSVFSNDSKVPVRRSYWDEMTPEDKENDFLDHHREVHIVGSVFDGASWQWKEVAYFEHLKKQTPVLPQKAPLASQTRYNLERINDYQRPHGQVIPIAEDETITVKGWAVDVLNGKPAGGVCIDIDGKIFPTIYGRNRPDVARFLDVPEYEYSGYEGEVLASKVGKGDHTLSLKILTNDRKAYYDTDLRIQLNIR
jgi:hypothetical protein